MCTSAPRTLVIVLALSASPALAQEPAATRMPKWDVGVTAGFFQANPPTVVTTPYGDDWYHTGRYGIAVGRYWTAHLKTEIEFAATSEGNRYIQRLATVPGIGTVPYATREYFSQQQASARLVWQFFDNRWVHPYVMAGVGADIERRREFFWEQLHYPTRVRIVDQHEEGPFTNYSAAAVAGIGTKFYVSQQAFINSLFQMTWTGRSSKTVSFLAGIGMDF